MRPLLFDRWVIRGYQSLDDFVSNKNVLYERTAYPYEKRDPGKHKDKFIYVLSKYFFDGGKKNSKFWQRLESSPEFDDCLFIYEDHEESLNFDFRWIEAMRRRRKGVYIKDSCPSYISSEYIPGTPIMLPGFFPVYDKWDGKPFTIYDFSSPNSKLKKFNTNRDIDVIFIGKPTSRRLEYMKLLTKACNELGLNYIISDKKVSFEEHIDLLRRSKISAQFIALGYRSSREWESMLNGCLLLSDDRTVDFVNTYGMKCGVDFIKFDSVNIKSQLKFWLNNESERHKIAKQGFETAWGVWKDMLDPYMPARALAAAKIKEVGWV